MKKINLNIIRSAALFLLTVSIIAFTNGCSKNSDYGTNNGNNNPPPAANQVLLQGNAFSPASMTVPVGTTVTWTNKDSYNHTVTSGSNRTADGKFDSGNLGGNGTFSYKFDAAGTYNYYCKLHSNMSGTIVVQ